MFGRKKQFDDTKKIEFAEMISKMLAIQLVGAPGVSIEGAGGRINRKALGYIYGYIDCALQSAGQDMSDVSVSVPIVYHVLRFLFPGREQVYVSFLIDHLQDEAVVLGMMVGGQQFSDYRPGAPGIPMALARFLLEGERG